MAGKSILPIAVAAGAAALLLMPKGRARRTGSRSSSGKDFGPPGNGSLAGEEIVFPVFTKSEGAAQIANLGGAAGLDSDWIKFFQATANNESGFTSNVVLGDPNHYPVGSKASGATSSIGPGEAAASRTAYARAAEQGRFTGCPWPKSFYTYGSGGWFGMIVSNAWAAYDDTSLRCRHPWYMLHPVDQIVTAIEIARRLKGWKTFKAQPTWLNLRVGWASPSGMNKSSVVATQRSRFSEDVQAVGLPVSWMDKKVTALPGKNVEGLWEHLMSYSGMPPGHKGAF
jgi:hypothetical protein